MTTISYSPRLAHLVGLMTGIALLTLGALLRPAAPAYAATITVTNANDTTNAGDGVSLREAINAIDASADSGDVHAADLPYGTNDTIKFTIPTGTDPACTLATGLCTIAVASGGLASIGKTVLIDGYTQPGASANTLDVGGNAALKIEVSGTNAGPGGAGLTIAAPGVVVRGLVLGRFKASDGTGVGVFVAAAGDGATITGCYIGIDRTGTVPHANQLGILVDNAPNVTIGGTTPASRNVISGNTANGIVVQGAGASGARVQGNYLGTKASGSVALGNGINGVLVASAPNATIGGTVTHAGNVASGQGLAGIQIEGAGATGALIQGNLAGTNAAGTAAIPNGYGVYLSGAPGTVVGGTSVAARNVLSGNLSSGVSISGGSTGTIVRGNYVGTTLNGDAALKNVSAGIDATGSSGAIIGGTEAGAGNLISGNGSGIALYPTSTPSTIVQGNFIGTNAARTGPLGNDYGIYVGTLPPLPPVPVTLTRITIGGTTPGAANVIASNRLYGLTYRSGTPLTIRGNSFYLNGVLGIDLGPDEGVTQNDPEDSNPDPTNPQNFPVLTGTTFLADKTRVTGTLNSTPETTFTLDFYANLRCGHQNYGEGQTYLGSASATTDEVGNATFTANVGSATAGSTITATATDPDGDTSEFSACLPPTVPGIVVTPTSGLVTTEDGGTATFTVRLASAPAAPVTIPISSRDISEGTVSPSTLTFAADLTALVPQTVTITGQNDFEPDGDMGYGIFVGSATSSDPDYNPLFPIVVAVTNRANDQITCSPRPRVTVTTAKNNDGRLRVDVRATAALGLPNHLAQLQFDAGNNASVQIPGQPTHTDAFTFDIPGQPTSFTFFVGRQGAGATTLPFRVIDGCASQPWKTFVGGGPGAF